jgi:uncharacterized protein (TIGR03067 family)
MGKRMKILVIVLLIVPLVCYGVRLHQSYSIPNYPLFYSQGPEVKIRLEDDDFTPAPPGTGPDGLYATWEAVYFEGFGKKASDRREAGMRLTFTPDKVIWVFDTAQGEKRYDGVYHIDPTRNPKEIDLGEPDRPKPERVILGVYKVEGDRLTIWGGAERPKGYSDSALFRIELKRVRPRP